MRVNGYALCSTPLDPNYRNVFDGYSNYDQYYTFLTSHYPAFEKTFNDAPFRSVKTEGLTASITVDGSADEIKNYNYCILFYEYEGWRDYRFYFVTNIESCNDALPTISGRTKPTCTLTLKYDSFTNNYVNFLNNQFLDDTNFIARRHYEDTHIVSNFVKTDGYISSEPRCAVRLSLPGTQYKVLWYKIKCTREVRARMVNPSMLVEVAGCKTIEQQIVTLYCPAFVVACNGNSYELSKLHKRFTYKQGLTILRECVKDDNFIGVIFKGSNILSVELTYHAPYSVDINNSTGNVRILDADDITDDGGCVAEVVNTGTAGTSIALTGDKTFGFIPNVQKLLVAPVVENELTTSIDCTVIIPKGTVDFLRSVDYEANKEYEARLYKFPFRYSVLAYGASCLELIPRENNAEYRLITKLHRHPKPLIMCDNIYGTTSYVPVDNIGGISTYVSSLDNYLQGNTFGMIESMAKSIFSMATGVPIGPPVSMSSAVSGTPMVALPSGGMSGTVTNPAYGGSRGNILSAPAIGGYKYEGAVFTEDYIMY